MDILDLARLRSGIRSLDRVGQSNARFDADVRGAGSTYGRPASLPFSAAYRPFEKQFDEIERAAAAYRRSARQIGPRVQTTAPNRNAISHSRATRPTFDLPVVGHDRELGLATFLADVQASVPARIHQSFKGFFEKYSLATPTDLAVFIAADIIGNSRGAINDFVDRCDATGKSDVYFRKAISEAYIDLTGPSKCGSPYSATSITAGNDDRDITVPNRISFNNSLFETPVFLGSGCSADIVGYHCHATGSSIAVKQQKERNVLSHEKRDAPFTVSHFGFLKEAFVHSHVIENAKPGIVSSDHNIIGFGGLMFDNGHNPYLIFEKAFCDLKQFQFFLNAFERMGVIDEAQSKKIKRVAICDAATAIDRVHDKDVAHNDIRHSNLYISHTGAIKLGDFGEATMTSNDPSAAEKQDRDRHLQEIVENMLDCDDAVNRHHTLTAEDAAQGHLLIKMMVDCLAKLSERSGGLHRLGDDEALCLAHVTGLPNSDEIFALFNKFKTINLK